MAEDQDTEERAVGYTSNNINSVPSCGVNKSSFHEERKLIGVPGQINNYHVPRILVDSGSPVTIISSDLWKQVKDPNAIVNEEKECFHGVTHDGLQIVGVTQLTLHFGKLHVKPPLLIVDKIAHKFILGNDFLSQYRCDLLNSARAIVFGGQQVPYTLFRSTVNSICPVICSTGTTIGPYEEMVLHALLDANARSATNKTLFLEPTTAKSNSLILKARVVVNYTSVVVPLLIANISSQPVTIEKGEVLAIDQPLDQNRFAEKRNEQNGNGTTPVQTACERANPAVTAEQKSALFALLKKRSEVFSTSAEDLGRTDLIYHTIDIGDSGPVHQGIRRIPHDQISVLKAEVDKLQSARMVEPSSSPFASPLFWSKKAGSWRFCIDYRKLNSVTKKDAHPLPRIEDIFDTLAGSKYFTTLDLAMGYHQVEMHPYDRE